MKTFAELRETPQGTTQGLGTYILSEAVHQKIQAVMDSEMNPKHKLNAVTKTARDLISKGEDTGLEDSKPKKGSSRAVFFPKEPKNIELDGHKVSTHSVVKIAFPGMLDKHNKSGRLLGEHQNEVESDHFAHRTHGIIHETAPGKYETNEHGVFPPHFGNHPDHHHLEMGRVQKIDAKSFKEATKTPEFPKGISHQEMHDSVMHNWHASHGKDMSYSKTPKARREELQDHPLVDNINHFVGNTDNHPSDLTKGNMGIWHHPVTGKKHVVLSDFGYNNSVAREYDEARKNHRAATRGY